MVGLKDEKKGPNGTSDTSETLTGKDLVDSGDFNAMHVDDTERNELKAKTILFYTHIVVGVCQGCFFIYQSLLPVSHLYSITNLIANMYEIAFNHLLYHH